MIDLKGLNAVLATPFAWLILILLFNAITVAAPPLQTTTTFKVGAWGDDASRHNFGVKAQIETRTDRTAQNTFSYFWVGDDLSDGAFIQFGYSLEPGYHCLRGAVVMGNFTCQGPSESISNSDARWQWQYWPDTSKPDFYFGIGPSASAGLNATFHQYTIRLNSSDMWMFELDGRTVAQTRFPSSPSTDPALVIAEGSAGNSTQPLGPVRFDALSYFDGARWGKVKSLIAASYCGISVGCVANEYGAVAIGPDSVLAGLGVPRSPDGTLLWTNQEENLQVRVHPGVQFFITSLSGTQTYDGNADVMVPDGMFVYVSLPDTDSSTPGPLGWLGARDRFQRWTGSIDSANLTATVLVDSNESVTAVWSTDTAVPFTISLGVIFALGASMVLLIFRRLRRERSKANASALTKPLAPAGAYPIKQDCTKLLGFGLAISGRRG